MATELPVGWKCPSCPRINAPDVKACPCSETYPWPRAWENGMGDFAVFVNPDEGYCRIGGTWRRDTYGIVHYDRHWYRVSVSKASELLEQATHSMKESP
jgi:hypothetical protein